MLEHREPQEPRGHGIFLGLGLSLIQQAFPDARILCLDDATGNARFDMSPPCPVFEGYRPDALLELAGAYVFVEIKSVLDLLSEHSLRQYAIVDALMRQNDEMMFVLVSFGGSVNRQQVVAALPPLIVSSGRFQFLTFEEEWVDEHEAV